jgi:osmotically-inducible protein OsmY
METNQDLLKQVYQALQNDEKIASYINNIHVRVNNGIVTLAGAVDSSLLKNRAEKIVSTLNGVTKIIQDLQVQTGLQKRIGVRIDWTMGSMAISQ